MESERRYYPQPPAMPGAARQLSFVQTNVSHLQVAPPASGTQRSLTLASMLVVSPLSVLMVASEQGAGVVYDALHVFSAGQSVVRAPSLMP